MMNRKRVVSLIAAAALVVTGTAVYGFWNSNRAASKKNDVISENVDSKKGTASQKTEEKETSTTDIGKDKAKSIALSHAGVQESATSRLVVEREYDDGRLEYHVEFRVDNKEYDYEISGVSGKVLDYDVEVADRD